MDTLSKKTFDELSQLLRSIRERATREGNDAAYGEADKAIMLLERFVSDLIVEKHLP